MGLSHLRSSGAASRIPNYLVFPTLALSTLLLVSGCNERADSDLAGVDTEDFSALTDDPSDLIGAEVDETVPNKPVSRAQAPTKLSVGDPNPGLLIAKWVKGDPIEAPLKDKVHVVEFWATWCPPCRDGN